MSFTVDMYDSISGKFIETVDEFDTLEEAEEYLEEIYDSSRTGAEMLEFVGESFIDPDDVDYEINEH